MLLVVIGAIAGLAAGWTGVGGPVLSVPLMVVFGFPALASIAASQVLQILAAASGSVGNLAFGSIDFALVVPVTGAEIAGVFAGAAIAHAVDQRVLRTFVGAALHTGRAFSRRAGARLGLGRIQPGRSE